MTRTQSHGGAAPFRAPPKGLTPAERTLAAALFAEAPTPMWDLLDDTQVKALARGLAARLKAPAPGKGAVESWTPPGEGMTHLLARVPGQPFLMDTIPMAAQRAGAEVLAVASLPGKDGAAIYMAVEALEPLAAQRLADEVRTGLALARAAVADHAAMASRLRGIIRWQEEHAEKPGHRVGDEELERIGFLRWMLGNNFIFLGYRHYEFSGNTARSIKAVPGSGLGILRDTLESSRVAKVTPLADVAGSLPRYLADARGSGGWLQISKTPDKSRVHRAAAMDYIGVLESDENGQVVGEHRFLGLYTSQAYTTGVRDIPLVRHKIAQVVAQAAEDPRWAEKTEQCRTLVNVLETFPRDELFLTPPADLARIGEAMARARKTASDVTVLTRVSPREQAVTVFLLAPIARYNSHVRERIRAFLHDRLGGTDSDFKVVEMGENDLAHLLFKVRMPHLPKHVDEAALADGIRAVVRGWGDNLQAALRQKLGAVGGQRLWQRFRDTFGAVAYQEATGVDTALIDLIDVQTLLASSAALQVRVHPCADALTLRIFSRKGRLALGQMMPVVGSFGLSAVGEQSYPLPTAEGKVWLHVLACQPLARQPDAATLHDLGDTVAAALCGEAEVDSLNSLMSAAGMAPLAVTVMRAFTAYLQQIDRRFDPAFVRRTLAGNPAIAGKLWELFETLHNPHRSLRARKHEARVLTVSLEQDIGALSSAEADRVARTLLQVVLATLRANVWQDAATGGAMAFKLDSGAIEAIPEPKPWREIFVYHPRVEGIHLRGGPVARGGLRHSDRATDYRTEVLGLMAAQMRKNTIIVPVGSKGGFYIKAALPPERAAAAGAIRACYAMYIRALLSVTDTRWEGKVLQPRGIVCHDGDDPYLVVAADKGTATFSDLANATAMAADFWKGASGGFWLGDAFASGGEHGYDHKEMGITARGAWVSVQHHMKYLKMEAAPRSPIRVAGIGDMGGDVFGNGLLQSPHVQLVGAFNHKHVFLDPNPDPKASYAERQRLFKAGLGWDGYDQKKLSRGGGVYPRSQKGLALSKEAQQMLGLARPSATPEEVIRAILKMNVDLLWNGGIGTYIKAASESHADVSDRANDDLRVDGKDVRARIIGEGGNLGISPLGRVELARRGVRLNTDALDNSAGVSTSDHEVNLKILFRLAKDKGKLTDAARNALLPRLTDAVAALVLADNAGQNMAVTMAEDAGPEYHLELLSWQQDLLKAGILAPTVDVLPDEENLGRRPHKKYVRPELCALLAGTKTMLRRHLASSDLPGMAAVQGLLAVYFPEAVAKQFSALIPQHALAPDIIATGLANGIVNRCGMLMARRLEGDFACSPQDALRAIVAAMALVDAPGLWAALDAEAATLPLSTQVAVLGRIRATLASLAGWVLGQGQPVKVDALLDRLAGPTRKLQAKMPTLMPEATRALWQARQAEWRQQGVSAGLAAKLAALSPGGLVPQTVAVALGRKMPAEDVLKLALAVGEQLELPKVTQRIRQMPLPDPWTRQAVQAMVREVFMRQCSLTERILAHKSDVPGWLAACGDSCKRYHLLVRDMLRQPELNVAMLSVLIARLRELEHAE